MGSLLFSDFLHEVRVQLTDKNDGFGFQKKISYYAENEGN